VGVFLRGGTLQLEGKSSLNGGAASDVEALVLFTDSSKDLKLSGQARFGAVVYAPNASASLDGQSRFGGHLFAKDLKMSGDTVARGGAMPVEALRINAINPFSTADAAFRLGEVYAFPSPARRGQRPTIHVEAGLADSVKIRIYDLAGDPVHEAEVAGPPAIINDGQGAQYAFEYPWNTDRTGSGVYVFVIEAKKNGEGVIKKIGKLAVIK
jgi:hypothetical protein